MNSTISTKIWMAVAAATVAGTVGIVGAAGAAAPTDSTEVPSAPRGARAAQVCAHLDEIETMMTSHLDHIATREAWLATNRAEAVDAGRDRQVEHIDRLSGRLNERIAKVQARQAKLQTWAADHCDPA